MSEPAPALEGRLRRKRGEGRERVRLAAAGVLGAIVAAFALLNSGEVKVHWLVASGRTPLIVVIVLACLCGMALDRLLIRVRRRRR